MVMQLKDEGLLDLDTKVCDLLPELTWGSNHRNSITVRHLLTHTSGIDGDLFTDTGRGDDCVEPYVACLADAQALCAPETGWSYCNSGFVLLDRIIEVLDVRSWDASLRARVTEPLGLNRFVTLPEDVLRQRAGYGHIRCPGASGWSPAPVATITRSMGPAGLITSSADDLLTFGASFLRRGDTAGCHALLSVESVAKMTDRYLVLGPAAGHTTPEWGWGGCVTTGEGTPCSGTVAPRSGRTHGSRCCPTTGWPSSRWAAAAMPRPPSTAACEDHWSGRYSDASTTVILRRTEEGAVAPVLHSDRDRTHPERQVLSLLAADGADTIVCRRWTG